MAMQILVVLGSLLTLAIGVWKWVKRMKKHRRKMADEGKEKIEKATTDGDASDLLDGFAKL